MPLSGVLERFFNYWNTLEKVADGLLPAKFDMLPTELHDAIPRITLLKRVHRYQVNVCMMRTTNDQTWHTPFVGMNSFDLTAPNMRENSAKLYAAILDHPAGALLTEKLPQNGKEPRYASSLYLPLADTSGHSSYIAGCSIYDNTAAYRSINDRLLPDHEQVTSVTFINIGAGIPDVSFENVHTDANTPSYVSQQWWSRLIPAASKPNIIKKPQRTNCVSNRWLVTPVTDAAMPHDTTRHS